MSQPDCYREDDRRVLEEICGQAADVVHNALVFERTQDESLKDALTGLTNARGLHGHLMREMERAERAAGQFAVVLLDFDHFKWINDQHGHLVGDLALKAVSRVLRETTRSYDICARYGGDEFVVLLASCGAGRGRGTLPHAAGGRRGHRLRRARRAPAFRSA